jgi:hypothetical protein
MTSCSRQRARGVRARRRSGQAPDGPCRKVIRGKRLYREVCLPKTRNAAEIRRFQLLPGIVSGMRMIAFLLLSSLRDTFRSRAALI